MPATLLSMRRLNEIGLIRRLGIRGVARLDVVLRRRGLRTLAHQIPERVPGTPSVIMAIVTRGVSAVPAAIPLSEPRGLPPVLEQETSASTAARTTAAGLFVFRRGGVTCG